MQFVISRKIFFQEIRIFNGNPSKISINLKYMNNQERFDSF
jgi:hypothetical protein